MKKRKQKKRNTAWYKKKLWKIFTLYVKERDRWQCFTCGKFATGWGMGGGHFVSAGASPPSLYFHEDNVHAQCTDCNLTLEGNHYVYGVKLGPRLANRLIKMRQELVGEVWSIEKYQEMILKYEQKYKDIKQANIERVRSSGKDIVGA